LLEHFNWSSIFFINIPVVVTALIAGLFLVPDSRDPDPRRLDLTGTLLSAIMLSSLVFGIIKGGDWGWTHPAVLAVFGGFIVSGFLFLLRERRTGEPMLDLHLFRNLRLSMGSAGIAVMTIAMFGMLFAFTMYMQFVKGYSAMETGVCFLPLALGYAFGSMFSNRFVGRFGTKAIVTAGFLGMAVFASVIAFWRIDTPYWQMGLLLFAVSYSMGNIMTPSLNAVLGAVPRERAGVGSAIGNVAFQVGGALGVAALGSALSSVYRTNISAALSQLSSLPAEMANIAKESVGAAATVAAMLPEGAQQGLMQIAGESFLDGWRMVLLAISVIGLVGAVLTLKFMPPREVRPTYK
jgi:predicted MFS family arabinose efflux permease